MPSMLPGNMPKTFQTLNVEGYHHLLKGRAEKALFYFQHALALAPSNPVILNSLGNALVQLTRFAEAIDAYNRAIDANPTYSRAYANLALVHQLTDNPDMAIHYYQQYLTLAPHDGEAYHNLGLLHMNAGHNQEAQAAFEAAAQHLMPDNPERATNLGVGFFFRGHLDTALSLFEQALRQDPSFIPAQYHLGVTHLCQGRCTEAIKALEAVLHAAPDYPQAAVNLAVAYNTDGQAARAVTLLETLQQRQPEDPGIVLNLGFAHQEAEHMEDAIASFRRVLTLPTATPDHVEQAQRALEALGVDSS